MASRISHALAWLMALAAGAQGSLASAEGRDTACSPPKGGLVTTSAEPRSGSVKLIGDWRSHVEAQRARVATETFDVYLVGDSLAQSWPPDLLPGDLVGGRVLNMGIAGDRTENVLWRVRQTSFPAGQRASIVNVIGTNNLDRPACEVLWGIAAVLEAERRAAPQARLIVLSLLPRGADLKSFADKIRTINRDLAVLAGRRGFVFVDAHDRLLCAAQDKAACPYFQGDRLHLRREGYEALATAVAATLSRSVGGN